MLSTWIRDYLGCVTIMRWRAMDPVKFLSAFGTHSSNTVTATHGSTRNEFYVKNRTATKMIFTLSAYHFYRAALIIIHGRMLHGLIVVGDPGMYVRKLVHVFLYPFP